MSARVKIWDWKWVQSLANNQGADMAASTKTEPKTKTTNYEDLSQELKDVMDRAVRRSREQYWCDIFDRFAPAIFGVPQTHVIDSDGLSCRGLDKDGYNKDGFDGDGYNREGRNSAGFNRDGFDVEGYDRHGMNRDGVDRQGRDKYRYDRFGYDLEGYDSSGTRRRASRDWYAKQAAKPETDFVYDAYCETRPAPKKTVKDKLGL